MKKVLILFTITAAISFAILTKGAASDEKLSVEEGQERIDEKSRSLAIGVTAGLVDDMSQLSDAITNDGVVPLNTNSLASSTGIETLLVPDSVASMQYHSGSKSPDDLKIISDYDKAGSDALRGVDLGIYVMYDFNELLNLPLFVRVGFDYVFKVWGDDQMIRLGPGPDIYAAENNFATPAGGFEGGTLETSWDSEWMEVPVTIGVVLPVMNFGNVYGGLGVSWFRGGFSINVKADDRYAAFGTSYSSDDYPGADLDNLMVTEGINEKIEFVTHGISFNMLLGFEAFIADNVSATIEYWASATMQTVYAESEFSDKAKRVLTMATAGPDAAAQDPEYIERFAYPVVIGGTMIKFGVRYYIL